MSDVPPFDQARAAFWLIVAVVGVQLLVVLAGVGACLVFMADIMAGKGSCDAHDKLGGLLASALAAALALTGGLRKP